MRSAGLGALAALIAACAGGPRAVPSSDPKGQPRAVSLKLPSYPEKGEIDLARDRGHVVLLDFWATWCEPCKDALPAYRTLDQQFGRMGFRVYAVNIDEDQRQIAAFLRETKIELPILLDPGGFVAERDFGVRVMPTSFLLDKRGVIRHVHEGASGDFLAAYKSEIEKLLQEPE